MGAWVSSVDLAVSPKASPRGPAMPSHSQRCWQKYSIPYVLGLRAHLSTSRRAADLAETNLIYRAYNMGHWRLCQEKSTYED